MELTNSLSNLLRKLFVFDSNYASTLSGLSDAASSEEDSVNIVLERTDGNTETVTIPSFHYLAAAIKRLEANIDSMANASAGSSAIRLSDGTYRKLVAIKLPQEAPSIIRMESANSFSVKSNYFFENMINPLLCVNFNVTGQVPSDTRQILSRRFILSIDTAAKKTYFDTYLKGKSDISYTDFLLALSRYNISYILDEEVKDMPLKSKRYSGKFSVLNIFNTTEDGVTRKFVRLDKLTYTDIFADYTDTMQLAVGDVLEVAQGNLDTRYKITHIDTSANTVILELLEGFKPVRIGDDYFQISAESSEDISVEVTVGFGEHCVVFLKAADSSSNLLASEWSPGSGFFTNELIMTADDGTEISLQQFYMRNCADFGELLLSYQSDYFPPSSQGIVPEAPSLSVDDLQVVQINKQVTENDDIVRIKEISAEKASLSAEITAVSDSISAMKTQINTTQYQSETARDNDMRQLQTLTSRYNSLVTEFSTKVSSISSLAQSSSVVSASPKYRIRGFFSMPKEKISQATGTQSVIKFITRYRYLNLTGNANAAQEINGGSFSNWNIVESILRPRVKGSDGRFVWANIDNTDSQEININQIDIPITKGETVEIQVKSVSEAGWPANPLMSPWSDSIQITFPEELSVNSPAEDIINQNSKDSAQMLINNTLVTRGLISHIGDSFTSNNVTFNHSAHNLFSGFKSADQRPIDLFTKLTEMQSTINNLLDLVSNTLGEISVDVTDQEGNSYPLIEDNLVKIYAGSYTSAISSEPVRRGSIMTKQFFVNIRNSAQTGLRLYSTYVGMRSKVAPVFSGSIGNLTDSEIYTDSFCLQESDSLYKMQNYGLVPINVNSGINKDNITESEDCWASSQMCNQFISFRMSGVSGQTSFYKDPSTVAVISTGTNHNEYSLASCDKQIDTSDRVEHDSQNAYPLIWNPNSGGGFDNNGNPIPYSFTDGYYSFCVSIEHPYIANISSWKAALAQKVGIDAQSAENLVYDSRNNVFIFALPFSESVSESLLARFDSSVSVNSTSVVVPVQTASANLSKVSSGAFFNKQVCYLAGVRQFFDSQNNYFIIGTPRIGYLPEDKYLIGKQTCGSCLYPNVSSKDVLFVNGDSGNSQKVIAGNDYISIPLTFQARMTDYYGTSDGDTGHLMGDPSVRNFSGLRVANRLGLDIATGFDREIKKFDIEIYANYTDSGSISPNTRISAASINSGALVTTSVAAAVSAANSATSNSIYFEEES